MGLFPGIPILVRDSSTLQFGTSPHQGVVVDGLTAEEFRLLSRLSPSTSAVDVERMAVRGTMAPKRALELYGLLVDAGVASSHSTRHMGRDDAWHRSDRHGLGWRDRLTRGRVAVRGLSPIGIRLAGLLVEAGVGSLALEDPAPLGDDEHALVSEGRHAHRRDEAVAAWLGGRGTRLRTHHAYDLSLGVVVTGFEPRVEWGAQMLSNDVAHLPIVVSEACVEVGPLVIPGHTPCLHCVGLAKRDADPQWPVLAAQLSELAAPRVESILAAQAAAFAAREVVSFLGGEALATRGSSWILSPQDPLPHVRTWQFHPECRCHAVV
ncbi:MAG: hypothetical protein Q4B10_01395 [Actinomycetaceae bacterium]|nr:hypothetical protein [Actinomycetaceae bacterium]